MNRSTEQEVFWETEFGDEYVSRNRGANRIASNVALFSRIISRTQKVSSILELGSNIGMNLLAIKQLLPETGISAVEINQKAADELVTSLPEVDLYRTSILEFHTERKWDLVFTKGVLIHLNPEKLSTVYDLMYSASSRYVMMAEYYNPSPVVVSYRGHESRLFKRDFAGEFMDRFPDMALIDYGFVYRRDPHFWQDDLNWFLMEKL